MGQKSALIIATAEYQDTGLAALNAPGLDAHDFAGALQSPEIGGFDSVQMLLNESEPAARRAIARFFAQRQSDDLLLLYFSGHGVRDDHGQLYLAVSDTDRSLLSATAIPANFINEQMNASRSRRQVLILDCCNSGAFAQGSKAPLGGSMGIAAAFEGTGYGRVVLTATDATQYAWEGDEARGEAANSVFTHYLVQGLETGAADANADGRITLDELYDYVYEQVVMQTPRQTPRKFAYNQQGDLVIAHNPRPVVKPAALPPELLQAIESPFAGVREGAVRDLIQTLSGSHRGLALAAQAALERLAQDDSRRVSSAAVASLAAQAAAQAEVERQAGEQAARLLAAQQEREAQQRAARERAAEEKAAAEKLAAEKLAAEKLAAEKAAVDRAAMEKAAADQAARERLAAEQAARVRAVPAPSAAAPASDTEVFEQRLSEARLQAAEQLAAQRAAAPPPVAAPSLDPAHPVRLAQGREEAAWRAEQPRTVMSAPTGLFSSEVLKALPARLPAAWPALAPVLYAVVTGLGWLFSAGIAYRLADFVHGDGDTEALVLLADVVYWVTWVALSGLVVGLVLAISRPAWRGARVVRVALGWAAAALLGWMIMMALVNVYTWDIGHLVGWGVAGALSGLVLQRALAGDGQPAPPSGQVGLPAALALALIAPFFLFGGNGAGQGLLAGLIGGGLLFLQLGAARLAWTERLSGLLAWPRWAPWIYTALAAVGWGWGWTRGEPLYNFLYTVKDSVANPDLLAALIDPLTWTATGLAVGLVMAVVLKLARPAWRWRRLWLLVPLWGFIGLVDWWLRSTLSHFMDWRPSQVLGTGLADGLAGLLVVWVLFGRPLRANRRRTAIIVAGWASAAMVSFLYGDVFSPDTGLAWLGLLNGAIGSGVLFWQMRALAGAPPPAPAA
jgi:hypothetical protein